MTITTDNRLTGRALITVPLPQGFSEPVQWPCPARRVSAPVWAADATCVGAVTALLEADQPPRNLRDLVARAARRIADGLP